MNCILDLNFDILNKINEEVIKKRKLMKYLDDKELRSKYEAADLFDHIHILKDIYAGVNGSILQVLEEGMKDRHYNLLDFDNCIEYTDDVLEIQNIRIRRKPFI